MPETIPPVRPGDLITSDLLNRLITHVDELEQRVAELEGGGTGGTGVTITGFDPPNQVAALQELRVLGSGFAFPPEGNQVLIDTTPVTQFRPGSTSAQLRFLVPNLGGIPGSGRNVTIAVTNTLTQRTARSAYRLLPPIPVVGDPPVITGIGPQNGSQVRIGEAAVIVGQNFSATASENRISFHVGANSYPPQGVPLQILATNPEEVVVIVPEITEVPAPGGGGRLVRVELAVGAHVPAVFNVTIRRTLL